MTNPEGEQRGHAHAQSKDTDESVRGNSAPVQINRIEISDRTMAVIALIFATAALMAGFWAINESGKSERESRLLQQQVMDQNALLLREGLRQPTDHSNGPAGNLQYKPKEK